jgi:hypothetical protein
MIGDLSEQQVSIKKRFYQITEPATTAARHSDVIVLAQAHLQLFLISGAPVSAWPG